MIDKSSLIHHSLEMLDRIQNTIARQYEAMMKFDLTPKQLQVLKAVKKDGSLTVNVLSRKLSLSPSSLSQIVKRLEKHDLLKRAWGEENRRVVYVTLGTKGEELFQDMERTVEVIRDKYYSHFTVEEIQSFQVLVEKLHAAVQPEEAL
ncbi:MarR family winged helix-turn-helix transcriptional regulator [Peribacillus sp. SCS-37]|uniref:MarR family winged helix-turn-helix transcriptional regulator n=1 Tax=Paraperibacillus esterisolvens TaxID=3115296 RepID=UPI0039065632